MRIVARRRGRQLAARAIVAVALLSFVGCSDTLTAPGPDPRLSLVDGAHGDGGNPHFFFLKPLLTPPAAFPGEFDVRAEPEVTVCEWSGSACTQVIATFTSEPGRGAGWIRVDPANEQFAVNWKTATANLDPARIYRLTVTLSGVELGHVDLDPVTSGRDLRNASTGEAVGLLDGATLPIKFRIERDALLGRGLPVGANGRGSCALDAAGHAWCWGEVGPMIGYPGAPGSRPVAEVPGGHVFVALAISGWNACGLTADGVAWCWGRNYAGQLGTGTMAPASSAEPLRVVGGRRFRTLSHGGGHICGLTEDGQGVCWGDNSTGALGRGYVGPADPVPAVVPGLTFTTVSAGSGFTCGVSVAGPTYCWGDNRYHQLGLGGVELQQPAVSDPWETVVPTPTPIVADPGFVEVRTGLTLTCARTAAGVAWCWGYNFFWGLGRGPEEPTTPFPMDYLALGTPGPVAGTTTYTSLAVGGYHACGIVGDQTARCWGQNWYGQTGSGFSTHTSVPQLVQGAQQWMALSAGWYHTCGLSTDALVWCWGEDEGGQIGTGTVTMRFFPTPYPVGGGFTGLSDPVLEFPPDTTASAGSTP